MCKTNLSKQNAKPDNRSPINIQNIEDGKMVIPSDGKEATDEYLFHINSTKLNCIKYKFSVGGVLLELLIDSGSEVNVIDSYTWENLKKEKIVVSNCRKGSEKQLRGYGSSKPLTILGEFCAKISSVKKELDSKFYVVKEIGQALLGRVTAMQLGVLKIGEINNVEEFCGKIKDVILDIPIDKNVTPVSQPYRRVPIPLESKVNKKIEDLLNQVRNKKNIYRKKRVL